MSESKELLEATIKGLEEKVNSLNLDLKMKQNELADVNKPEMTNEMFDTLTDLVDDAVNDVYLNEDELEYSVDVDYDRRINIHDVSFNNPGIFSEKIMSEIDGHYKIIKTVNPTESTSG